MTPAPTGAPADLVNVCRVLLASKTNTDALAQAEHARFDRATRILRAVVAGGSLQDPEWAGSLVDHATAVNGFVESLRTAGAFDGMFASMTRLPTGTHIAFATIAAVGAVTAELGFKPVSRLTLDGVDLTPRKAVTIFVLSDALARAIAGTGGDQFLTNELRAGVAAATDLAFLPGIAQGATEVSSNGGGSAVAIYEDLASLQAAVRVGAQSRLFYIMSPALAGQLALKPDANGQPAFPQMSAQGGEIGNTPVLVSDGLESASAGESILLVDAAAIVADVGTITLSRSTAAALQLDSAPTSGASAVWQSLWQSNRVGLKAERYFAFRRLRDDSAAELRGIEVSAT